VLGLILDTPNTLISDFERREKPIAPSSTTQHMQLFVTTEWEKLSTDSSFKDKIVCVEVQSLGSSSNTKVLQHGNQVLS
jgi:hypothetical protein